jgi:hypothetical protein
MTTSDDKFGLIAIGFAQKNGGALRAPAGSTVTVTPARDFFVIEIALPNGAVATCTIHQIALRVRERASTADK